jgi:hypothetical protein
LDSTSFFISCFFFFLFFFGSTQAWTQGLHIELLHQPFFLWRIFFKTGSHGTVCPGWLWTVFLLISDSWVVRITGVSHQRSDPPLSFCWLCLCPSFWEVASQDVLLGLLSSPLSFPGWSLLLLAVHPPNSQIYIVIQSSLCPESCF